MTRQREVDWRCGILDLLEAAAMHRSGVDVRIAGRWRRVVVADVPGEDGEDWLVTVSGDRIAVADIEAARPSPGAQRNC